MTRNQINANMTAFKTLTDEISDQFLACKICLETYKRPKTLSCLHTFCTSCLEAHLASEEERTNYRFVIYSRSITCPVCKQRTEVPSGGIKNLPDNFLVSNLTEVVNRSKPSSSSPACDICSNYKKRTRDAVSKCLECSKFLCRNCVDLHKKTKVTKGHTIFDVEVEKNIMCKCHEEEPVRFFCQPCETCICVLCTFQGHVGHEVSSFGEGILKYVGNVQSMLKVGKTKMASVQRHLDVMTKCEETIAQVEERVNKLSTAFLTAIRTQQKHVIDEIRHFYGSEALEILDNKDELEAIMSNLKSTCGLAELILENRNVELLLLQKEVKEKMKSLINVDLPDLPDSMEREITFVEGSLNLGFLDTGNRSALSDRQISKPSMMLNTTSRGSKDACTMTVRMTKDRGVSTDQNMSRTSSGHYESLSMATGKQHRNKDSKDSIDGTSQENDCSEVDHETKLKNILQRRDSLHNIFKDDEKFFASDNEEEREVTLNVEDISSSTIVEVDESVGDDSATLEADDERDKTLDMAKENNVVDGSHDDRIENAADDTANDVSDDDVYMDQQEPETKTENDIGGYIGIGEGHGKQERTFYVDEYIESETIEMEESCPNVVSFRPCEYRDAATVTEDIEIQQHYSELCLETDGGQTLSTLDHGVSSNRETMAEFNVQRLSAGNFPPEMFRRQSSSDQGAPWQIIHDMHQLPIQTEDKGINVPEVMESDSCLEIEFIDIMLRDCATSTEIVDRKDQQTMTECVEMVDQNAVVKQNEEKDTVKDTLIKSNSLELFTKTISDTLAITADAKKGLLELADGFYDIKDLAEFTLIETENAITPDGTILFSKTVQLSDQGTETDAEVKVQMSEASCGVEVPMQDQATEVKAEMVESSASSDLVTLCDLGTQTTVTEISECETMTENPQVVDFAMLTETPIMRDSNCGPDYQSYSTVGTATIAPESVDQAVGSSVEIRDIGCGDSIASVKDIDVTAIPEMVDSACSPEIVCYTDTCLQTEGWDFKDAYVDTDSIGVREIFTEMPQLQLMDIFTNTLTTESVDQSTSTDNTQFVDQGSATDATSTNVVGTLTDLLRMCDATVETTPLETSDAASEISPESSTKETMTPLIATRNASSSARFRRRRPAREDAGTSTDSAELVDSATDTFTETNSIGLSVSPETCEDSTETVQPFLVDAGVEAAPDLVDTGTLALSLNTRDSSTDPIKPQQVSIGINTYIVSLAPRKRDASTTTSRTMEEISQELESVVLRGAVGGDPTEEEPKQPDVNSELLGQKISELFSLSKLQTLTEQLAQDRRRMEEQRSRKHVLPTARMLEKRLSTDESQPTAIRRRLSSQKSLDIPDEIKRVDSVTDTRGPNSMQKSEPQVEEKELSRKKRPQITALLNLSKVSEVDAPVLSAVSLSDLTPAESSLEVTPGVSPCLTPSGDNLSSFSDQVVEPVREKKRKHKKEKKKLKEKEHVEDERRRKSSSLKSGSKLDAGAMGSAATTPEEDNPKKYKLLKKSFFSLGRFSRSMPTLARLDEKIDRFFHKSTSRETTPSTSVTDTPKTSRAGSPERRPYHHRKARPAKVAALLEQTIIEKAKSSSSEGGSGERADDPDGFIVKESNV
ncbi:uncharacterized protein LOC135488786 [Lineus longissimus]|uniref:uncharacterized protein LOC135488786 n=1 Tax=Lineus longissimus TaxID=88925 RepID=UPI002B4EBF07